MTLKQKREIVRRFLAVESVDALANWMWDREKEVFIRDGLQARSIVEQVLRDYMKGEFTIPAWFTLPRKEKSHD